MLSEFLSATKLALILAVRLNAFFSTYGRTAFFGSYAWQFSEWAP
jgi:hypothetical protein